MSVGNIRGSLVNRPQEEKYHQSIYILYTSRVQYTGLIYHYHIDISYKSMKLHSIWKLYRPLLEVQFLWKIKIRWQSHGFSSTLYNYKITLGNEVYICVWSTFAFDRCDFIARPGLVRVVFILKTWAKPSRTVLNSLTL